MQPVAIGILIAILYVYVPFAISSYRLMSLAQFRRRWRAFVPFWNILILMDLAERERIWSLAILVPIVSYFVLPMVAGQLAVRTGTPRWIGWICGWLGLHIVGLPLLAVLAKDKGSLNAEYDKVPVSEWRYRSRQEDT